MSWDDIKKSTLEAKGLSANEKELICINELQGMRANTWPVRKEKEEQCEQLQTKLAALDKELVEIQSSRAVSASMQENVEYVVLKSLQEVRKAAQRVYNVLPGPVITTFSGTTAVMLAPFFFRYFHSPS